MSRREDFRRVYGREPTEEELETFEEYVRLVKAGRRLAQSWETTEVWDRNLKMTRTGGMESV